MSGHEGLRSDFVDLLRDAGVVAPRSLADRLVHVCVLQGLLPELEVRRCPAVHVNGRCVLEFGHGGLHRVQPVMGPIFLASAGAPRFDRGPADGDDGDGEPEPLPHGVER